MFWTSKIDSFTKRSWFFVAILLTVIATATSASEAISTNKKILVLGDSLSAGLGVDYQQSWPLLLQKRLDQGAYNYSVINAGISGDTTSGGVSRLPKLIKFYQPEILILELGGNDGLRGTSLKAIEKNLRHMINLAQRSNITVLLIGVQLPPNYGIVYTAGFEKVFSVLAKEYSLKLIQGALKAMVKEGLMQPDGVHPNIKGHREIEKMIWEHLSAHLKS
ncbi:MAG TPA: arylesterase [Candidatus Thioglobus sp.]|jgi:acyl-CoA thioesterase-1|nr:arylesterase [Candidatus Thioglobus sp.]HIK77258.1 arylesterase [Gammaproteobacteria bacterium]